MGIGPCIYVRALDDMCPPRMQLMHVQWISTEVGQVTLIGRLLMIMPMWLERVVDTSHTALQAGVNWSQH